MSIEREKLQTDQTRLWQLLELKSDDSEVSDKIYDLVFHIIEGFSDLINKDESAEDSHAYLHFCLRYIESNYDNTIGNIEYEICQTWQNVVADDDFPALLEKNLLTLIEDKKIRYVFRVEEMAKKIALNENYLKAITYFEVLNDQISDSGGWNSWAHCYAVQSDFANAIKVLSNGIQNYPDSALLACNKAFYLHESKKNNQALKELQVFIERAETDKYADDHHYLYAIKLKASIYRQLDMPLQALIEYSRLSAAGNCDPEFLKENAELLVPQVEVLSNG